MRPAFLSLALLAASPALAEVELSFYGGWQGAPDGGVTVSGAEVDADDAMGDSVQLGLRAAWWSPSGFGVALDYSHFGLDAEDGVVAEGGLAFDDIDTLTVNGMRRWDDAFGQVTPYVGAGLGIAFADIEVAGEGAVEGTGPAVSWVAGASVPITESWSVFGEYEGTFTQIEGNFGDGGSLETETVTNSINLGVSFSF